MLEPADAHALRLEHAHWPLIIMLLLSQLAAGMFLTLAAFGIVDGKGFLRDAAVPATAGFVALNAGLAASVFHLGRPLGAWRFFLGLRTSWMSREILAFGIFAAMAFAATALCWLVPGSSYALTGLVGAAVTGLAAVFTSVMIYADTRRAYWALPLTALRFLRSHGHPGGDGGGGGAWMDRACQRNLSRCPHRINRGWDGGSVVGNVEWSASGR